ncbi:MAG: prolyl oligopeptidase family serine peptidase [Candidatus Curtissbacteria bacterium]|nr:prolyl oligopeptidase family serine peptidase [Candidatus Curtissbacteria bacterium]
MKFAFAVLFLVLVGFGAFFANQYKNKKNIVNPFAGETAPKEKPLDKYQIENLSKAKINASEITLGKVLADEENFTSYVFYFYAEGKRVSGLLNVPKGEGVYPVVMMFRGYVDKEIFQSGVGTQRAGEVFAKNGFVTLASDFLGYGESDNPSENSIEERFQAYITAVTVLESVGNLNATFLSNNIAARVSSEKVGIWGHSNGGQIALTVLEITGKPYPSVLWAPVSKPFPYSVLYYTDEFDDRGKALRKAIADFEDDYDIELYNLTNFFMEINAPLQVHQGSADDAVPIKWSDSLVAELEKLDKDVEYFTYPGADHNLIPTGWNLAISRAMDFYGKNLGP